MTFMPIWLESKIERTLFFSSLLLHSPHIHISVYRVRKLFWFQLFLFLLLPVPYALGGVIHVYLIAESGIKIASIQWTQIVAFDLMLINNVVFESAQQKKMTFNNEFCFRFHFFSLRSVFPFDLGKINVNIWISYSIGALIH